MGDHTLLEFILRTALYPPECETMQDVMVSGVLSHEGDFCEAFTSGKQLLKLPNPSYSIFPTGVSGKAPLDLYLIF